MNEVFLMEVPENDNYRLSAELKEGENSIGECRFDINPFFDHPGNAHTLSSEVMDNNQ